MAAKGHEARTGKTRDMNSSTELISKSRTILGDSTEIVAADMEDPRALEQAVGNKGIGFRCAKLFFRAANAAPRLKRLAFASFAEE